MLNAYTLADWYGVTHRDLPESGEALVADIEKFLRHKGLDHLIYRAADVAQIHLNNLSVTEAERDAFAANEAEGIGDQQPTWTPERDAQLADRVAAMSMTEFQQFRREAGLHVDTASFLGGTR